MAARIEIQCIVKSDRYAPYHRITYIGGKNSDGERWALNFLEAIEGIQDGSYEFYILRGGLEMDVVVSDYHGKKYLKTEADELQPNSLLNLPQFTLH